MSDNYVLDILLSEDDYMGTGFTKKQYHSIQELFDSFCRQQQRSPVPPSPPPSAPQAQPIASPPAHKPCTQAPPELPPQPPTRVPAPVPTRSYPPSPSVETVQEVELKQVYKIPLRDIRQMRMKHGASKKTSRSQLLFFEKCVAWPAKLGGIDMRFSRDENLDAWYTTMLNATDALPYRTQCYAGGRHHFLAIRYRAVFNFFVSCRSSILFRLFRLFVIPTIDLHFLPSIQLILYRPLLVASNTLSDTPEPLFTSYLCGCCPKTSLSPNPDFQRRNLGNDPWNSAPVPPTTRPHGNHRAMQDPIGQWYADMDMRNATDRAQAMRALLFFVFCRHVVTISLQRWHILMVDAKAGTQSLPRASSQIAALSTLQLYHLYFITPSQNMLYATALALSIKHISH